MANIDNLQYYKQLRRAGYTDEQAQAHVDAMNAGVSNLVTTTEIDDKLDTMGLHLDNKFNEIESRMDNKFNAMESRIDNKFNIIDAKFENMGLRMDNKFNLLEQQIKHVSKLGYWIFIFLAWPIIKDLLPFFTTKAGG